MYRVVTHTIKEEHFEHPYLAEKGMEVHSNTTPGYGNISTKSKNNYGSVIQQPPMDGNIKVKTPMEDEWGGHEYWNNYHCWGDLTVHGSTTISNDLIVAGTISGRGSVTEVMLLDTAPAANVTPGNIGALARTSTHMYLCVEQDKWIRWELQESW